jgi:hypothetical protein
VVPGNPTSTEFVFGHEEASGTEPYLTVPWSIHGFDFQDTSKDYYWTVIDDGARVSLSVGTAGGGPTADVFSLAPYTTAVPLTYKGIFVQAGAGAIFDHVTVRNPPVVGSVEETIEGSDAPRLALAVVPLGALGAATFEVTKREGLGFLAVYTVTGRKVGRLDLPTAAGVHTLRWDGVASDELKASSGVYFARVVCGAEIAGQKFVLLR